MTEILHHGIVRLFVVGTSMAQGRQTNRLHPTTDLGWQSLRQSLAHPNWVLRGDRLPCKEAATLEPYAVRQHQRERAEKLLLRCASGRAEQLSVVLDTPPASRGGCIGWSLVNRTGTPLSREAHRLASSCFGRDSFSANPGRLVPRVAHCPARQLNGPAPATAGTVARQCQRPPIIPPVIPNLQALASVSILQSTASPSLSQLST